MITCKLTLTDWFTKKKVSKIIMPKDPIVAAKIHSKNNPNCIIDIETMDSKPKTFTELPYNMQLDQVHVEDDEYPTMTMDQFTKKWYGKISKAKIKEIEQEVESEYKTEEHENI